jgi:hypothetical protein
MDFADKCPIPSQDLSLNEIVVVDIGFHITISMSEADVATFCPFRTSAQVSPIRGPWSGWGCSKVRLRLVVINYVIGTSLEL